MLYKRLTRIHHIDFGCIVIPGLQMPSKVINKPRHWLKLCRGIAFASDGRRMKCNKSKEILETVGILGYRLPVQGVARPHALRLGLSVGGVFPGGFFVLDGFRAGALFFSEPCVPCNNNIRNNIRNKIYNSCLARREKENGPVVRLGYTPEAPKFSTQPREA